VSPVTYTLSAAMVLLGLAMIIVTVARGGGPLATGVLAGLLFMAAGAGRIYAERRR
jgi:hypothetical protein